MTQTQMNLFALDADPADEARCALERFICLCGRNAEYYMNGGDPDFVARISETAMREAKVLERFNQPRQR